MTSSVEMKINCFNWLIKPKSLSKLQLTQFTRKFGKLETSNKLIFIQYGAPTHRSTNVSKCKNENQWIIFCRDVYMKSKVYVKIYENISDLTPAIILAFQ